MISRESELVCNNAPLSYRLNVIYPRRLRALVALNFLGLWRGNTLSGPSAAARTG